MLFNGHFKTAFRKEYWKQNYMKIVFKIKQLAYKIWSLLSKEYSWKTESHFVNNRRMYENFHISLTFVDSKALTNI